MVKHIYSLLLVTLCSAILSFAAPYAHAAEYREEGVALIDRKGPNALMFDGHGFTQFVDRYMQVTGLTRFYDENNEPISLAALKIPCQAQIVYRQTASDEMPEAISVNVLHYFNNKPGDTNMNLPVMRPDPLH